MCKVVEHIRYVHRLKYCNRTVNKQTENSKYSNKTV